MQLTATDPVTAIPDVGPTTADRKDADTVEAFITGIPTVTTLPSKKQQAAHAILHADMTNATATKETITTNKLNTAVEHARTCARDGSRQRGDKPHDFTSTGVSVCGQWNLPLPDATTLTTQPDDIVPAHLTTDAGRHDAVYILSTNPPYHDANHRVHTPQPNDTDTVIPARPLNRIAAAMDTTPALLVDSMYYEQDSPVFIEAPDRQTDALIAASYVSEREQTATTWPQATSENAANSRHTLTSN